MQYHFHTCWRRTNRNLPPVNHSPSPPFPPKGWTKLFNLLHDNTTYIYICMYTLHMHNIHWSKFESTGRISNYREALWREMTALTLSWSSADLDESSEDHSWGLSGNMKTRSVNYKRKTNTTGKPSRPTSSISLSMANHSLFLSRLVYFFVCVFRGVSGGHLCGWFSRYLSYSGVVCRRYLAVLM